MHGNYYVRAEALRANQGSQSHWFMKAYCALQVAGILVVNAHTVTDMSGEGFAVRLFRQGNQGGFVRAISDQPQSFAASFSKVLVGWIVVPVLMPSSGRKETTSPRIPN